MERIDRWIDRYAHGMHALCMYICMCFARMYACMMQKVRVVRHMPKIPHNAICLCAVSGMETFRLATFWHDHIFWVRVH